MQSKRANFCNTKVEHKFKQQSNERSAYFQKVSVAARLSRKAGQRGSERGMKRSYERINKKATFRKGKTERRKRHMKDALALGGDEGRDKLR